MFKHNDIESCEKQLQRAQRLVEKSGGGIFVITEGVFGMSGNQGKLKEIVELKKSYNFRIFVDDEHGFGTMGKTGSGTAEEQGVTDQIDLIFSTFAKSMASIGAFVAGPKLVLNYLRYNLRSQIYAKSLPMPLVVGALKRLDLIRTQPQLKEKLWENVNALQSGLKEAGFNIGITSTPVTPVILNGTVAESTHLTYDLRENYDIFCSIVVYPVIPKGLIILRLIPTAAHSLSDVERTIKAFKEIKENLEAGKYRKEELMNAAIKS
jgi:glycine C-acetyltransferase